MHQGCDGSFGGGGQVVDKLRMMDLSGMPMPIEAKISCEGCGSIFEMKTVEDRCPDCGMVYGVTPCHATDLKSIKAAGIGY